MTPHSTDSHKGDRYRQIAAPVPSAVSQTRCLNLENAEANLLALMMKDAKDIGQIEKRKSRALNRPAKQPLTDRQKRLLKAVGDFGGPVRTVDLVKVLEASSSSIGTGLSNLRARGLVKATMTNGINLWVMTGNQAEGGEE